MRAAAALLLLVGLSFPAAAVGPPWPARIAILIDDLGESLADGRRVIELPGPVACAILPHTPHALTLADAARHARKEVLLHLPMAAANGEPPGPGQIDQDMPALEVGLTLEYDLESVPHAVGVNNHMGSRLTAEIGPMRRLMQAMQRRGGLYFVDSRTSALSVAATAAREHGIPVLVRDLFLDHQRDPAEIEAQFDRLIAHAQRHGAALAIAHPYPETLAVLERRLPQLMARADVKLVTLASLIATPPAAPE